MAGDLRSGGFGFPGLDYGSRTGGLSRYRIGDDGDDLAYLEKLSAQTAWQNGQITDDAYLSALRKYVNALEAGTSAHVSAVNQLEDATWNIGRNELVHRVNGAATARQRIAALNRLIGYDRRWRNSMTTGNEQHREITARIDDLQQQVRSARWGQFVERYNNDQLSNERMLVLAKRMARAAAGSGDRQTYRGYVQQFEDAITDDALQDAMDEWEESERPAPSLAKRVEQLYRQRMAGMDPASPGHERMAEGLADFGKAVDARKDAYEYEMARSAHDAGTMADDDWLDYLHKRVNKAKKGTVERIRARDTFINESFSMAQTALEVGVSEGTRDVSDLIDFYQSSLAIMDLDSSRAQSLLATIEQLRAKGFDELDISRSAGDGTTPTPLGGHWVYPSGPGVEEGFISQHDGSSFASTNCGMAAAAMLAWDVTGGSTRVSGGELRYYSGDRDKGTWTDDMVTALGVLGIGAREFHGMTLSTFRKRIAAGKPAVLTGTNAMLPAGMRYGFDGDHSVFVSRVEAQGGQTFYWVMDPNGPQGYTGAWWTEDQLFSFGWQGSYTGSAVFAGKSGNATAVDPASLPPIQRFDTDWAGRSTLNRGGGANRAEAGPRRDWSHGKKAWKLAKKAGGAEAVDDFLGVVDKLESRLAPEDLPDGGPDPANGDITAARIRRASKMLTRNGNDPRRAIVEWFTGVTPENDPSEWSKTERWYANVAARKLELEVVKRKPLSPTEEPEPPDVTGTPDEPGTMLAGLDPDLEQLAVGLLERLGVEPTETNVRSIAAWVAGENGGSVKNNNPLHLLTATANDLEGQYGRAEDGSAIFDSMDEGLDAAAAELQARAPSLVGALRNPDPEEFMRALDASGWSEATGYGAAITASYNQLPGRTPIIYRGAATPFGAPTTFSQLARTNPEVAELADVDPTDPVQMAWFEDNLANAREAAEGGQEQWGFILPGSDAIISIPSSHQVARDLLKMNYGYTVETTAPTPAGQQARREALEDYTQMSAELDMAEFRRHYDESMRTHDAALALGDWTTAYNIELEMIRGINAALGLGPDEVPDIASSNIEHADDDLSFLADAIDRAVPRSVDPKRTEELAPNGSPLLQLEVEGDLAVETMGRVHTGPGLAEMPGYAVTVEVPPDVLFMGQRPDGQFDTHTKHTSPDLFEPVRELDPVTGEAVVKPRYQTAESGLVAVTVEGMRVYQPLEQLDTPVVELYVQDYSGASRDRAEQQRSAGQQAQPASAAFVTQLLDDMPSGDGEGLHVAPAMPPDDGDALLRKLQGGHKPGTAGQPVIYQLQTYDSTARETVTWLSLDRVTWIGWMGDLVGKVPPGLVAQNGATWVTPTDDPTAPPQLFVGGDLYDPETMGDVGQFLGWYGAGGVETGTPGVGAPNGDYMLRGAGIELNPDGTPRPVMTDLSVEPLDRWRAGTISYTEAAAQQRALDPEAWERGMQDEQWIKDALAATNRPVPSTPATTAQRRTEILASLPGGLEAQAQIHEAAAQARAAAAPALYAARREAARAEAARRAAAEAARSTGPSPSPGPAPSPKVQPAPTPPKAQPAPTPTPPKPYLAPTPQPTPTPVTSTEAWREKQGTIGGR